MKAIRQIIGLSPVLVVFVDKIHTTKRDWITLGRYCTKEGSFTSCIQVLKILPKHRKLGVLLHEIGHAKCDVAGCECAKSASWLGEHHADMYALQWLLDNKKKKALRIRMRDIKAHTQNSDYYAVAAIATMDSDLWRQCEIYTRSIIGRIRKRIK